VQPNSASNKIALKRFLEIWGGNYPEVCGSVVCGVFLSTFHHTNCFISSLRITLNDISLTIASSLLHKVFQHYTKILHLREARTYHHCLSETYKSVML
jgi:hypothetical protein